MITVYKTEKNYLKVDDTYITAELRGLSTDEKPTEINGKVIDNGSTFVEIDTGKVYLYDLDGETWNEV